MRRQPPGVLDRAARTATTVAALEIVRVLLLLAVRALDAQSTARFLPVTFLLALARDAVTMFQWLAVVAAAYTLGAELRRAIGGLGAGVVIGALAGGLVVGLTWLVANSLALIGEVGAAPLWLGLRDVAGQSEMASSAVVTGVAAFALVGAVSGLLGGWQARRAPPVAA